MATSGLNREAYRAFAEAFTDMFADTTYALILGNKEISSYSKVPASGSLASSYNAFFGDVGVLFPAFAKPMPVTKWIPWQKKVFITWDAYVNQQDHDFYCENSNKVYLCLNNGNGAISGVPPTGTSPYPVTTEDGYEWQYLYSISGTMNQYIRKLGDKKWMPVPRNLTQQEYNELASTNPAFLKKEVEDKSLRGALIRFHIGHQEMKNVRWDSRVDVDIIEKPSNSATWNMQWEYESSPADANKRGHRLVDIGVEGKGSEYPMSTTLTLGAEPTTNSQNITGNDSNHIVGKSTNRAGEKGPFIYAVVSPPDGFRDAVSLLYANQVMLIMVIDPVSLRQYTNSTSWNTAAVVKNPLYKGKPIQKSFSAGEKTVQPTYFSAATEIKLNNNSAAQALTPETKMNSIAASGNATNCTGMVLGNTLTGDGYITLRLGGQAAALIGDNDRVFQEVSPDSWISNSFISSSGATKIPSSATVQGIEKTPISFGADADRNYSEVLHTFEFSSITLDPTDIGKSLTLAFLMG